MPCDAKKVFISPLYYKSMKLSRREIVYIAVIILLLVLLAVFSGVFYFNYAFERFNITGNIVLKEDVDNTLWANIRAKLENLRKKIGEKQFNEKFRILVNYALEEISSIIYLCEYDSYPIKIGHKGERVYDNIVDRIYSNYYDKLRNKIQIKNKRGNVYLQVEEIKNA